MKEGLKSVDEGRRENRVTPRSSFPLFSSELSDTGSTH